MDVKKCFNALKKCNEIGKKMTQSSIYVLINGMIIAYQNKYAKDDKNEYVAYGVNISTIADNLVSSVKYKVEEFTGMEIEKINIYVEGVRAID